MRQFNLLPEIDASVWKKSGVGRKDRVYKTKITVPDETIIAMRRMHEIDRKPIYLVIRAFPQFSESYIRHVLEYTIRANLKVRP